MKSKFNSNLFNKQVDLNESNTFGGRASVYSGCTDIVFTNGQSDDITYYYDEDGNLIEKKECYR